MVERKGVINLRDADYGDRLTLSDIEIQDEIVQRAQEKAPNTVTLGFLGLIGGAILGGAKGAVTCGILGCLAGFFLDEELQST